MALSTRTQILTTLTTTTTSQTSRHPHWGVLKWVSWGVTFVCDAKSHDPSSCSKRPQTGIRPAATAARTLPSHMGHLLYLLRHQAPQPSSYLFNKTSQRNLIHLIYSHLQTTDTTCWYGYRQSEVMMLLMIGGDSIWDPGAPTANRRSFNCTQTTL